MINLLLILVGCNAIAVLQPNWASAIGEVPLAHIIIIVFLAEFGLWFLCIFLHHTSADHPMKHKFPQEYEHNWFFFQPTLSPHIPGAYRPLPHKLWESPDFREEEPVWLPSAIHRLKNEENRPYRASPSRYMLSRFHGWSRDENILNLGCYCTTVYKRFTVLAGCAVLTTRHIITTASSTWLVIRDRLDYDTFEDVLGIWYDDNHWNYNSSRYMSPSRIHFHPLFHLPEHANRSHPFPFTYDLAVWATTHHFYGWYNYLPSTILCERGTSASSIGHWKVGQIQLARFYNIQTTGQDGRIWIVVMALLLKKPDKRELDSHMKDFVPIVDTYENSLFITGIEPEDRCQFNLRSYARIFWDHHSAVPSGELYVIIGFQFIWAYKRKPMPWNKYFYRTFYVTDPCPKSEWGWFICLPSPFMKFGIDSGAGLHRANKGKSTKLNGLVALGAFSMYLRSDTLIHYFTVLDTHPVLDFLYDAYLGKQKNVWLDKRYHDTNGGAPKPKYYIPHNYDKPAQNYFFYYYRWPAN